MGVIINVSVVLAIGGCFFLALPDGAFRKGGWGGSRAFRNGSFGTGSAFERSKHSYAFGTDSYEFRFL